jgi:hypothetical protein
MLEGNSHIKKTIMMPDAVSSDQDIEPSNHEAENIVMSEKKIPLSFFFWGARKELRCKLIFLRNCHCKSNGKTLSIECSTTLDWQVLFSSSSIG